MVAPMIWTARLVTRVIGVVLLTVGFLCVPVGLGASPKRDTSLFFNFADAGVYLRIAVILVPLSVAVIILSYLLPGDD